MDRVQEMRRMRENDNTLQEIADKYGISRERVRQLIGNTGFTATYTKVKKNRAVYQENKHRSNSFLTKLLGFSNKHTLRRYRDLCHHEIDGGSAKVGEEAEKIVSKKLFSLGFSNTLMPTSHPFDILLHTGSKIDVKSSNPMSTSKTWTSCYSFRTSKYTKGNYCDFLILYLRDIKEYFVVPTKEAGGIIRFCWPEPDWGKKSQWLKYYNRFDLLKG